MGSCVPSACVLTGVAARRIATAATGVGNDGSWRNDSSVYCRIPRGEASRPSWRPPRRRYIAGYCARKLPYPLSFSWLGALVVRRRSSRCFGQLSERRRDADAAEFCGQSRAVRSGVRAPPPARSARSRFRMMVPPKSCRATNMHVEVVRLRCIRASQYVHRCALMCRAS